MSQYEIMNNKNNIINSGFNNPRKHLGQNFLKSHEYASLMVKSLEINENDRIIEIGPGRGALTTLLIECKFKDLILYEIDFDLAEHISEVVKSHGNVSVKRENILDADLFGMISPYKIIGSIPYYITSPIIHKFLAIPNRPETVVLLVQKEFGEKLLTTAPKSTYWSYITMGYKVEKVSIVKAENFNPKPKVDSMILKFVRVPDEEENLKVFGTFKNFSKFLHHVYKNPRKMISKAFNSELLIELGISPNSRPQNLSFENIIKLYESKD